MDDIPTRAILLYASMRWRRYVIGRAGAWREHVAQLATRRRFVVVTAE